MYQIKTEQGQQLGMLIISVEAEQEQNFQTINKSCRIWILSNDNDCDSTQCQYFASAKLSSNFTYCAEYQSTVVGDEESFKISARYR